MSRRAPAEDASVDPLRQRRDGAEVPDRFAGISLIPSFVSSSARRPIAMIEPVRSGAVQGWGRFDAPRWGLVCAPGWSEESLSFRTPGGAAAWRLRLVVRGAGQRVHAGA
jgi:hypothetical protein